MVMMVMTVMTGMTVMMVNGDGDDVLLFCRTSTCVVVVPAANIGPPSSALTHNL